MAVTHLAGGTHHKSNHAEDGIHADSLLVDRSDLNDIAASISSMNLSDDMKFITSDVAVNSQTGNFNNFSDMDIESKHLSILFLYDFVLGSICMRTCFNK